MRNERRIVSNSGWKISNRWKEGTDRLTAISLETENETYVNLKLLIEATPDGRASTPLPIIALIRLNVAEGT